MSDDWRDAVKMQLVETAALETLRHDEGLLADAIMATGSGSKLAARLSREYAVPLEDCEWVVLAAAQQLHDEPGGNAASRYDGHGHEDEDEDE